MVFYFGRRWRRGVVLLLEGVDRDLLGGGRVVVDWWWRRWLSLISGNMIYLWCSVFPFCLAPWLRLRLTAPARRSVFPLPTAVLVWLVSRCLWVVSDVSPFESSCTMVLGYGNQSVGRLYGIHRAWVKGCGPWRWWRHTMFGPGLVIRLQSPVSDTMQAPLPPSRGHIGLSMMALRWMLPSVLKALVWLAS